MVNRMWQHFFGYGFTMPVDDMGPHNPVSHPELLDFLSRAFVKSGYDMKRLMYWIASTDAWQRSSVLVAGTEDVPEAGAVPLFTRVYARHLDPEEVYDSIRVAIRSVSGQPSRHPSELSIAATGFGSSSNRMEQMRMTRL